MDPINNACKLGSDAWLELQAFKTRQLNRRVKLNRHKNLRNDLINGTAQPLLNPSSTASTGANSFLVQGRAQMLNATFEPTPTNDQSNNKLPDPNDHDEGGDGILANHSNNAANNTITGRSISDGLTSRLADDRVSVNETDRNHLNLELVECLLLLKLCDVALKLPIDSRSLQRSISKIRGLESTTQSLVGNLLQKFAHQELIAIEEPTAGHIGRRSEQIVGSNIAPSEDDDDELCIYVTSADHTKLVEFDKSFGSLDNIRALLLESKADDNSTDESDLSNSNHNSSIALQSIKTAITIENSFVDSATIKLCIDDSRDLRQNSHAEIELDKNSSNNSDKSSTNRIDSTKKRAGDDLESLLSLSSTRERESKKIGEELLDLLSKPTAKERNLIDRFRSADGYQVQEFCAKGTKGECCRNNKGAAPCDKLHFKKIIAKHTEESLGDCSFLNTCFHMDSCKYVHYEVDYDERPPPNQFKRPHPANPHKRASHQKAINKKDLCQSQPQDNSKDDSNNNDKAFESEPLFGLSKYTLTAEEQANIDAKNRKRFKTVLYPPQWIQCDLRFFDMSLLGKFSVVMADPPWDIHMELPYGTMSDDEMRKLNVPALQDEGVIFLWVTGRAMELGRECLALWGYERCDEIIWVKTNQLQRIIRTGRTGHWLNHGKEHCLVGVKGNPKDINRGLDCDVIVAEVRATSHKPDEIYGIIERLSPGTRKIELFGREHNVQPNWITLGNQLNGARLIEPNLKSAFKKLNLPFETIEHVT